MNYWIFNVTPHKGAGYSLSAQDIYQQRMHDHFWGLGEKTPNRKNLQPGDKVVFYVGRPDSVFAGTATLASSSFSLTEEQKEQYSPGISFYIADYGVLLEDVETWSSPVSVQSIAPELRFIENEEYWYAYFQGGIRQIVEDDYQAIINARLDAPGKVPPPLIDVVDQARFALEKHLEEFIYQNWASINWGLKLELYQTEDQNGRQFPAGTWSINFLALDKTSNTLVVIELKRGHTSDSVVGQILRYMNWVRENIAVNGQKVRGIIVAQAVDEALKYAVKSLDDVDIKTYVVNFTLTSFAK